MEKAITQKSSDCIKVVLFGPESSGKTTMAKALASHYDTMWVPEFMRTYLQEKWDLRQEKVTKEDIVHIAQGQLALEKKLIKNATNFLFCDTNVLELKVYSEYYYDGFCPPEISEAIKQQHYDYYFLTQVDTPWVADDLRDRPYDREKLFCIFEAELKTHNLPYTLLEGSEKERLQHAITVLAALKEKRNAHPKGY